MPAIDFSEVHRRLEHARKQWDAGFAPAPQVQQRILSDRARRLALALNERPPGDSIEVVAFEIAAEAYAIETHFVREVCQLRDLAPVPCTPPFVLGIINVRGEVCPVIDLKRFFGMPARGLTNATRAVIVRDAHVEFGILADVIVGVRTLVTAEVRPPPLVDIKAQFLRGITGDGLIVLDAGAVLTRPALVVNEEVVG